MTLTWWRKVYTRCTCKCYTSALDEKKCTLCTPFWKIKRAYCFLSKGFVLLGFIPFRYSYAIYRYPLWYTWKQLKLMSYTKQDKTVIKPLKNSKIPHISGLDILEVEMFAISKMWKMTWITTKYILTDQIQPQYACHSNIHIFHKKQMYVYWSILPLQHFTYFDSYTSFYFQCSNLILWDTKQWNGVTLT